MNEILERELTAADALYPGLAAIYETVAGYHLYSDADKILEEYFDKDMGRAVIRNRNGASKTPKVKITVAEALSGAGTYLRPNGENYQSRKWGSTDHEDVQVLRTAREKSKYALLYGAPGTGKTALVEAAFGDELYTILGTGDTEVGDLIGGYVQTVSGGFEWIDGPLVKAASEGKPLLIDEIGLIDPKVLSVVYGLMDGRKELAITANPERGTVISKQGFYVVAATNPNAPGVVLSEALLSRFAIHAEMTTDWSIARKLGVPAVVITAAQNLAKKFSSDEVSWSPQMREVLAFRDLAEIFGTTFAVETLLASAPELDRPVVEDVFSRAYGEQYKPAKI